MPTRRIIVLANSVKKGGRCVAGRALTSSGEVTEWIRPVSAVDEGTLMPEHMTVNHGHNLDVLDVVNVPLEIHNGDQCHPEDWLVDNTEWEFLEKYDHDTIADLEDNPNDLWLEDSNHSDRATCGYLQSQYHHQSLYLIRPQNLHVRLWRVFNKYKGYNQKKTRVVFNYLDNEYALSLTDPVATRLYCNDFPVVDQPANEFTLPFKDKCLLCISLTPQFNGYHYKVAATILELP